MLRSTSKRFATPLLALAAAAAAATGAFVAAVASPQAAPSALAAGTTPALDGTRSPRAVLAAHDTDVVVALFSLPGCPYCEVVRRNYLRHLENEISGVRVVEYGIGDERAFTDAPRATTATTDTERPASAAALAESFGIRIAPTVVFLADEGKEVAERLIGYDSPDFYGAYLERRIASALERARQQ